MSATIEDNNKGKASSSAIVSDKVKNYAKDPFFVKKAEAAKKTLERVGLPGQKEN